MAQEAVNAVIQALQGGFAQVQRVKELQQQKEERQRQLDIEQQRADEQKRQFDLQQQANSKLFDLRKSELEHQQAQQELQQSQIFQQTGITPPGAQVIPGLQATPDQPLVLSGAENSRVVFPSGTSYQVPPLSQTPGVQLQKQAANEQEQRIIQERQAQEAAATIRAQATQAAETERMLKQIGLEHTNRLAELKQSEDAADRLENKRAATSLAVARIAHASELMDFGQSPVVSQAINMAGSGAASIDDLRKTFGAKQIPQITNLAAQQGITFLPKEKTNQLNAIEQMTQILPKIERAQNLQALHPIAILNPLSAEGREFSALTDEIRAAAPQASVATTGVRRFSNPELDRFDSVFLGNKLPTEGARQANRMKLNDFKGNLRDSIDILTRGLQPAQSNAIHDRYTSNGLAPKITVIKKATGQKGTISPEYFDPNIYDKATQ